MSKEELKERINELEVSIKETEDLIKEAFEISKSMVEPYKGIFVKELALRQIQLNTRKIVVSNLKGLLEMGF